MSFHLFKLQQHPLLLVSLCFTTMITASFSLYLLLYPIWQRVITFCLHWIYLDLFATLAILPNHLNCVIVLFFPLSLTHYTHGARKNKKIGSFPRLLLIVPVLVRRFDAALLGVLQTCSATATWQRPAVLISLINYDIHNFR